MNVNKYQLSEVVDIFPQDSSQAQTECSVSKIRL